MSLSYEELENGVKSWGVSTPSGQYDCVGVIHLLAACLDNLRENAIDADLKRIPECLNETQQLFLRKMSGYVSMEGQS